MGDDEYFLALMIIEDQTGVAAGKKLADRIIALGLHLSFKDFLFDSQGYFLAQAGRMEGFVPPP